MADDRHVVMAMLPACAVTEAPSLSFFSPVASVLPGTCFVRVTTVCPFSQFDVDLIVYVVEGRLGDYGSIVSGPALDNRIEGSDKCCLRGTSVLADDAFYLVLVAVDG
jgi:hypothetical protein